MSEALHYHNHLQRVLRKCHLIKRSGDFCVIRYQGRKNVYRVDASDVYLLSEVIVKKGKATTFELRDGARSVLAMS